MCYIYKGTKMKTNICTQNQREHGASYITMPQFRSWFGCYNTDKPGVKITT
jgi:hypothetical protein